MKRREKEAEANRNRIHAHGYNLYVVRFHCWFNGFKLINNQRSFVHAILFSYLQGISCS